jgi:hypothetical protein
MRTRFDYNVGALGRYYLSPGEKGVITYYTTEDGSLKVM